MLNQFHANVVWGMRGNFLDLPTDCPQRDERLGWTGDIAAFAPHRRVPVRRRTVPVATGCVDLAPSRSTPTASSRSSCPTSLKYAEPAPDEFPDGGQHRDLE